MVAADGDMDKAIDVLREKGLAKGKKSGNIAAEGLAEIAVNGNTAAIIEVNPKQTLLLQMISSRTMLIMLLQRLRLISQLTLKLLRQTKMSDGQTVDEGAIALTTVIGEKISLRRFQVVEKTDNEHFGKYLHNGGQIAALTVIEGADDDTAKDVAMHVAAINPEYLDRTKVPAEELKHQTDIFTEETKNEGKPEKIVPRIVEGRVNKWLGEISLWTKNSSRILTKPLLSTLLQKAAR